MSNRPQIKGFDDSWRDRFEELGRAEVPAYLKASYEIGFHSFKVRETFLRHLIGELCRSAGPSARGKHSSLDLGCNAGLYTKMLHDRKLEVFGVDYAKSLLREAKTEYPHIDFTTAVRGGPAINDATLEDAGEVGMQEFSRVITTGLAMAGVDLESCSQQFKSAFGGCDVIIAKGQGNFETLDRRSENIYFLFQVKCDCVSRFLGADKYSAVLWSSRRGTRRD